MPVIRIAKSNVISPLQAAMVFLVAAVLAGSCLLTSGPRVDAPPEGEPWKPGSILREVAGVLDLNYSQTTSTGTEIKGLVFGIGTALAVLVVGFMVVVPPKTGELESAEDIVVSEEEGSSASAVMSGLRAQIPPLRAGQVMVLAFGVWSFLSSQWSDAPNVSLWASVLLLTHLAWAFSLGLSLNRASARPAAVAMVAILALTAAIAIWYQQERLPLLRASYPIGNPLFLAACLIPGVMLGGTFLLGTVKTLRGANRGYGVILGILSLVALACTIWAFQAADARGPLVGVCAAVAVLILVLVPKRFRWPVIGAGAVAFVALGWMFYRQAITSSPTGRDATIRARLYAWDYAVDLISDKPLLGHGEGGYVRLADSLAATKGDAENDPIALNARITHAHSEWLEVLADLGSIGAVLILAGLGMTVVAAWQSMERSTHRADRLLIAGLLASLIGIVVSEFFGVGLRVPGLPAIFFTVLGLLWACCASESDRWLDQWSRRPQARLAVGVVAVALALLLGFSHQRDFQAARNEWDVRSAADHLDWERAVDLAESSVQRLDPHRRLVATVRLADVQLTAALSMYEAFQQKLSQARSSEPPDPRIAQLAQEDLNRVQRFQMGGMSTLKDLAVQAPLYWNANALLAEFHLLRTDVLLATGYEDAAEQERAAAIEALKQELRRQPFNPAAAQRLVDVGGPSLEPAEVINTVARPLRASSITEDYSHVLLYLGSIQQIREPFEAVLKVAADVSPDLAESEWGVRWAPEILTWGALIRLQSAQIDAAADYLAHASQLYEGLTIPSRIGLTNVLSMLANTRFLQNSDDPAQAMDIIARALETAPDSEIGRRQQRVLRQMRQRFYLAINLEVGEAEVRRELKEMFPGAQDAGVNAEMAGMYSSLCLSFIDRTKDQVPRHYGQWIERSIALYPDSELAWRLRADFAFDQGEDAKSADYLNKALELGANPQLVLAFIQVALTKMPESEPLKALESELEASLSTPSADATEADSPAQEPVTGPPAEPWGVDNP